MSNSLKNLGLSLVDLKAIAMKRLLKAMKVCLKVSY